VLAPLEDLAASLVPGDWHTRVAADRDSLRRVGVLLGPFTTVAGRARQGDSGGPAPGPGC
jgi:hypothetical protein